MTNRRLFASLLATALWLAAAPRIADAQSTIAGVARDSSGAVLPGVTVEAASDVLIEKIRTVVSDGEGRYAIVDIRPGSYVVTFTLTGFSTFKRDGIVVPANTTVPINAELRVGAVAETVTVGADAGRRCSEHDATAGDDTRPHRRDPERPNHA